VEKPEWLLKAEKYLGECEVPGVQKNNQFILDCFKHTSYQASADEVPWCSAFMCRILEEAGMQSTGRADAKSWLNYGTECELKAGAIVVVERPDGGLHVTLCSNELAGQVFAGVGGNQGDKVKVSFFKKEHIKATRWPVGKQKIEGVL
jgi:uncharacterized protein (TIGR02594 family)